MLRAGRTGHPRGGPVSATVVAAGGPAVWPADRCGGVGWGDTGIGGSQPDAAYNIRLIHVLPDGRDCATVDGMLTTDASGDGGANG